MGELLNRACKEHDLSGIGANVFDISTGDVTVYIHWDEPGGCSSGTGPTFDDALQIAVAEMHERRRRAA
jgi:hypothetical protein